MEEDDDSNDIGWYLAIASDVSFEVSRYQNIEAMDCICHHICSERINSAEGKVKTWSRELEAVRFLLFRLSAYENSQILFQVASLTYMQTNSNVMKMILSKGGCDCLVCLCFPVIFAAGYFLLQMIAIEKRNQNDKHKKNKKNQHNIAKINPCEIRIKKSQDSCLAILLYSSYFVVVSIKWKMPPLSTAKKSMRKNTDWKDIIASVLSWQQTKYNGRLSLPSSQQSWSKKTNNNIFFFLTQISRNLTFCARNFICHSCQLVCNMKFCSNLAFWESSGFCPFRPAFEKNFFVIRRVVQIASIDKKKPADSLFSTHFFQKNFFVTRSVCGIALNDE